MSLHHALTLNPLSLNPDLNDPGTLDLKICWRRENACNQHFSSFHDVFFHIEDKFNAFGSICHLQICAFNMDYGKIFYYLVKG